MPRISMGWAIWSAWIGVCVGWIVGLAWMNSLHDPQRATTALTTARSLGCATLERCVEDAKVIRDFLSTSSK